MLNKKVIAILLALNPIIALGGDTGFLNPSTCESLATGGSSAAPVSWSNATNALTQNNTYATATAITVVGYDTRYLYCHDYSASIPGAATITGIQMRLYRKNVSCTEDEDVHDGDIRFIKVGTAVGTNQAVSFAWGCTDGAAFTFPHPDPVIDSLWGTTLTPTEANDSSTGFGVSATEANHTATETFGVEVIQARYYYDLASDPGGAKVVPVITE